MTKNTPRSVLVNLLPKDGSSIPLRALRLRLEGYTGKSWQQEHLRQRVHRLAKARLVVMESEPVKIGRMRWMVRAAHPAKPRHSQPYWKARGLTA